MRVRQTTETTHQITRRQRIKDRLAFPLIAFLSTEQARAWGLTPLDHEWILMAIRHCSGFVLDIGCGSNELIRQYGSGIGTDVFPWEGIDLLCDSSKLPFRDTHFDTVTLLACLNHITDREGVLWEARRVLKAEGRLVITMINPVVGAVVHRLRRRHDPDQVQRGIHAHEKLGLWPAQVKTLLRNTGFALQRRCRFVYGLNSLYVATKAIV